MLKGAESKSLILALLGSEAAITKNREYFPPSVGALWFAAGKVKNPQVSAIYLFDS